MTARPGYEPSDLPAGPAALAIAGLLALIVIGALAAWAMTAAVQHRRPATAPNAFQRAAATPAFPRLEVDARADRLAIEARAQARLAGYGWSDRQARLAHVPIERAMALQAAEGWPDADPGSPSTPPTKTQESGR
jgi:hypothetical protein